MKTPRKMPVPVNYDIKTKLLTSQPVPSGYDIDYTFSDVVEHTPELNALLNDLILASTDKALLDVGKELIRKLTVGLELTATEISESFK